MQGDAKGLTQHYGYWVIFITTPVMFLLTLRLIDRFLKLMGEIDSYAENLTDEVRSRLRKLVSQHRESLMLRTSSVWILVFLVVVMTLLWLFNVIKTIDPLATYHHDVFDAYPHRFGFYAAKAYVFLYFTAIYSVAIFIALHVTVSMISILRFLARHGMLRIDLFHADNCGGTSAFGNINLMILAIYANLFAVDFAMYLTHRQTYLAIVVSLSASCFFAMAQSVVAVYYIHQQLAKKKRESIDDLARRLNEQFLLSLQKENRFPGELLALRKHLAEVNTYPYAAGALAAVNVIRFAPAVLAVVTFFSKHS